MREPSFACCLPSPLALLFPSFSPPQFSSPWSCLGKVPARQILAKGQPSKEQNPREMPPTSQALSLLSTVMLIPGPLKEIVVLTTITESKAQPVGVGAAQTMEKIPAISELFPPQPQYLDTYLSCPLVRKHRTSSLPALSQIFTDLKPFSPPTLCPSPLMLANGFKLRKKQQAERKTCMYHTHHHEKQLASLEIGTEEEV